MQKRNRAAENHAPPGKPSILTVGATLEKVHHFVVVVRFRCKNRLCMFWRCVESSVSARRTVHECGQA